MTTKKQTGSEIFETPTVLTQLTEMFKNMGESYTINTNHGI